MNTMPGHTLLLLTLVMLGAPLHGTDLASLSTAELLTQSRAAYSLFPRKELSQALAAKGVKDLPQLTAALGHAHWHVRHCALLALKTLAQDQDKRAALQPLVPKLAEVILRDPALGVRMAAADCLGALGEQAKSAQKELAKASVEDAEDWMRLSAAAALSAVHADPPVMMVAYEAMIRSTDKVSRGAGISKAAALQAKNLDISSLVPALKNVFLKPLYDANYSHHTREAAMNLLVLIKADLTGLASAITHDLATIWKTQEDGYHPYQRITLKLLGKTGIYGESAIPVLEAVIANPANFGCARSHPDYPGFIADSRASIQQIRAALASKGTK